MPDRRNAARAWLQRLRHHSELFVIELREWSRMTDDLNGERNRLCNRLREQLWRYFAAMLQAGIYLAPSQFETGFLSTAHTDEDIEITLRAGAAALQAVAEKA